MIVVIAVGGAVNTIYCAVIASGVISLGEVIAVRVRTVIWIYSLINLIKFMINFMINFMVEFIMINLLTKLRRCNLMTKC